MGSFRNRLLALIIGLCVLIGALYLTPGSSVSTASLRRYRSIDPIKKALGIVWLLLGPIALYFLVKTAIYEIARNPIPSTRIQWSTFVIIFIPIAIGLVIFGYYALKGEYNADGDTISPRAPDITID